MRKTPALIATVAVLALGLTGCSGTTLIGAPAGDASRVITATGAFGQAPQVEFPTPLYTKATQRSFAIQGPGTGVEITGLNQVSTISWTLLDGTTGQTIPGADWTEPKPMVVSVWPAGLQQVFLGAHAGDRVVAAVAPEDGLGGTTAAVLVADITTVFPDRATGRSVPVTTPGLPSVVTAPDGTPGITLPPSAAPKKAISATLRQGDGAELTEAKPVLIQTTVVDWETKKVVSTTWGTEQPGQFVLSSPTNPIGLVDALKGATVGSQVIAVLPPAQLATGDGNPSVHGASTLVFVVDILGEL